MASKKTLVIGASSNPDRYSYKAVEKLNLFGHEVETLGLREGNIGAAQINTERKIFKDLHSVSLYLSEKNQESYKDYILSLKPKRVIFNPGTENPSFYEVLNSNGIEATEACTLVMLSIGNF